MGLQVQECPDISSGDSAGVCAVPALSDILLIQQCLINQEIALVYLRYPRYLVLCKCRSYTTYYDVINARADIEERHLKRIQQYS